jgi:hypothetical protein
MKFIIISLFKIKTSYLNPYSLSGARGYNFYEPLSPDKGREFKREVKLQLFFKFV